MKNYMVTGAGRDIGQAIAVGLADEGSFAILHYANSSQGAEETLRKVRGRGGDGALLRADFTKVDDLNPFLAGVGKLLKGAPLDALIHNAAFTASSESGDLNPRPLNDMLTANILYPYLLTEGLAYHYHRGTSIVAVTVASARRVFSPDFGFFSASKAALETLVYNWAQRYGPKGVRANGVAPGVVEVNFRKELLKDQHFRQTLEGDTALGRVGKESDVSEVVKFLCMPESSWISGQVIEASGGWRL